jgi:hypothetical protein
MSNLSKIVKKFNDFTEDMLNQMYISTDDNDIRVYESMFSKLRKINSTKAIEQFIIFVLPYKDKIINEDESFFLNQDESNLIKDDSQDNIMKALKFKQLWSSLSNNSKENLFKFFKVLVYYAEEYFKNKYSNLINNETKMC